MAEHTPTTEIVREAAADARDDWIEPEEFDRWLAAHDREVAAKALREFADDPDVFADYRDDDPTDFIHGASYGSDTVLDMARAHADRIERGA